jgi:hypothetical protein
MVQAIMITTQPGIEVGSPSDLEAPTAAVRIDTNIIFNELL